MQPMNRGILFALGAYLSWGLFPLYFRQIATIPALQVVAHRTLWSLAFVAALLLVTGHLKWLREVSGATAAEEYALQGYVGFVTVASRVWVERGCPAGERDQLRQAALDALFSSLFTSEAARAEQRRSKFRR